MQVLHAFDDRLPNSLVGLAHGPRAWPRLTFAAAWLAGLLLVILLAPRLGGSAELAACIVLLALATAAHFADRLPVGRAFGWANGTTLLRLALLAAVAATLPYPGSVAEHGGAIFAVAALAWSLDAVDGALARRMRTVSTYGARFDMEVDGFATLVLALALASSGRVGWWVLAAFALRPLFILGGRMLPWLGAPLPPRRRRRLICAVQIGGLVLALAPGLPSSMPGALAAAGLALLLASFAADIHALHRRR